MFARLISTTRIVTTLICDDLRGASSRELARRLLRIALLLATGVMAAVALPASAAEPARPTDPVYNIELVIVRPVAPIGVPEDWSVESSRSAASGEAEEDITDSPATNAAGRIAVRTLGSAQYRLAGVGAAISRSKGYELVRHVGWTQAATPRGAGLAVELSDIARDGEPVRGTVALERGRYLHLRLDLAYAPAAPPNSLLGANTGSGLVTFTLRQNRRVKPFERHYFDHPAFGVIAMVSPVGGRER